MTEYQSQTAPGFPDRLAEIIAAQDEERLRVAREMFINLTERERLLVKEAAVMGFFIGQNAAGGVPREEYPKDSDVLFRALDTARVYDDLYPTLAALEDM